MFDTIRRLSRSNKLVYVIGKLTVLSHDNIAEFDSLLERIIQRLEHYEKGLS